MQEEKWIEGKKKTVIRIATDIASFSVYLKTYVSCECDVCVLHSTFFMKIGDVLIYFIDEGLQLTLFAHIRARVLIARQYFHFTSHFSSAENIKLPNEMSDNLHSLLLSHCKAATLL